MSEGDFKAKYPNNPPNLLSDCEYRNRPQPRYKLVEKHGEAAPEFKYLPYKQCLPGSYAIKSNVTVPYQVPYVSGRVDVVNVTNDYECKAVGARNCSNAANCEKTQTPLQLKGKPSPSVNSQGKI